MALPREPADAGHVSPASSPPPVGLAVSPWRARSVLPDDAGGTPAWVRAAADMARLVVPVQCPGCGARDVRWCSDCAAPWWAPPLRSESGAPRLQVNGGAALPVWAVCSLEGQAHGMVAAWKDAGRRDLDAFFCHVMSMAAEAIAGELMSASRAWAVVPVPSRRASIVLRGVDLPMALARSAATALAARGIAAEVVNPLCIGRGEQRGASASSRARQAASISVMRSRRWGSWQGRSSQPAPMPALLIDDVMTTGASLAAAARALEVTFLTAAAGLCLAAAPAASARGGG